MANQQQDELIRKVQHLYLEFKATAFVLEAPREMLDEISHDHFNQLYIIMPRSDKSGGITKSVQLMVTLVVREGPAVIMPRIMYDWTREYKGDDNFYTRQFGNLNEK